MFVPSKIHTNENCFYKGILTGLWGCTKPIEIKLNAGIITERLQETKEFYTEILDFDVTFENDFYILLHTPDKSASISFLQPNHPSQQPIFQSPFKGEGVYLTIDH